MQTDHPLLFIPGPTEVRPELLAVLSRPQIGHRSEAMKELIGGILARLRPVFGVRGGHTLFESCPATALMEAGVRNLVRRRVLHLTCGAFSERWQEISRACGKEADALAVPWGKANRAEELTRALASGQYDAVAITHNETSTGVMNPLAELCAAARQFPDVMVMVDVVTSLAGAPVDFDERGIDLAFASVQKGLALPAGFTVYALSTRALERARTVPGRGWLLDFPRALDGLAKGQTLATPSIPHVFALDVQLRTIEAEGLPARFARHAEMARRTQDWGRRSGVRLYADPQFLSPTVTNFEAGPLDVDRLRKGLKQAGFQISDGYGKLKGKAFRIGHMGDHTPAVVDELLAAMDRVLQA
jgi:predicted phosphoserine aminotransferase